MNENTKVEEMLQLEIFLSDIDFLDRTFIGDFASRSIEKYENSVMLLRYNNQICYLNNINAIFKAFRCSTSDKHLFFKDWLSGTTFSYLKWTCQTYLPKERFRTKRNTPRKLDAFNIPYRDEQKLFKKLAIFGFESICVKRGSYKETETTKWTRRHVPISVSVWSNLIPKPIFLCKTVPHHLLSSFVTDLEGLATQTTAQKKFKFIENETEIKVKLCKILKQLIQKHNQAENSDRLVDDCIVESEEQELSTQFLQTQKNHFIDVQEHFECYCNMLPVFGFNSAK